MIYENDNERNAKQNATKVKNGKKSKMNKQILSKIREYTRVI